MWVAAFFISSVLKISRISWPVTVVIASGGHFAQDTAGRNLTKSRHGHIVSERLFTYLWRVTGMSAMSKQKQTPDFDDNGFGDKGRDELSVSYAEMLLSGKPMGRRKSHHIRTAPRTKPRAKTKFGRKANEAILPNHGRWMPKLFKRRNWKTLAVWGFALVMFLQLASMLFNVPLPTLGGRQLWTDVRVMDGWRVQCHSWTGHCRVLDRHDLRRNWGGEAEMLSTLDGFAESGVIKPPRAHVVVLVHGLGRSAHSLDAMAESLGARGFEPVQFNYASTQGTIEDHAKALNRVVEGLGGTRTVSFVTHSLGGPVVRKALALKKPDYALGRVVMLAPPSRGSSIAETLAEYVPMRWLFGPALTELTSHAMTDLPGPSTSFAIVAGQVGGVSLTRGKSDGLVSIAETKLDGADKHIVVDSGHTFIMNHPDVMRFTADFIGDVRS